ncbi:MAG: hypothetical protein IJO59_07690 [Clostridia bacterium]|nr:hypothetical protein [Clostridia bacterium]
MEFLRNWSGAVCFAAVGCSAIRLLVSEGKTGKIYQLLVVTFFICSMITPLLQVSVDLPLDVEWLPQEMVTEQLTEKVTEQLAEQVKERVTAITEECLSYREAKAEKIVVKTNVSKEGNIYIEQVVIVVDKKQVPRVLGVRDVLEEQLGTTVSIRVGGENGEEVG